MARGPNIPHELIIRLGMRELLSNPEYANLPYVVYRKAQDAQPTTPEPKATPRKKAPRVEVVDETQLFFEVNDESD